MHEVVEITAFAAAPDIRVNLQVHGQPFDALLQGEIRRQALNGQGNEGRLLERTPVDADGVVGQILDAHDAALFR